MADTAVVEPPQTGAEEALNSLQRAFDKVAPDKFKQIVKDEQALNREQPLVEKKVEPTVDKAAPETKLPAFLEKSLGGKEEPAKAVEDEIPSEPPAEIKDEKAKSNWMKLREKANKAEKAFSDAQAKIAELEKRGREPDEPTKFKLEQLETKNREMAEALTRFGLETNETFQTQVIRPLHAAYSRARQIVGDAGGDVEALDKALSLNGKAQYEALDTIYADLPDSAKRAADKQIETFREFSIIRNNALKNAPQTFEQVRKDELIRQKQTLDNQKVEFERAFDSVVDRMTNVDKFELFQESKDPDTSWWNQIKPRIVSEAKNDYLHATQPEVVSEAALARRSLPVVTELWRRALDRAVKAETELASIKGSEPKLSDSGGGGSTQATEDAEDANLSFPKLFLKHLKKQGK